VSPFYVFILLCWELRDDLRDQRPVVLRLPRGNCKDGVVNGSTVTNVPIPILGFWLWLVPLSSFSLCVILILPPLAAPRYPLAVPLSSSFGLLMPYPNLIRLLRSTSRAVLATVSILAAQAELRTSSSSCPAPLDSPRYDGPEAWTRRLPEPRPPRPPLPPRHRATISPPKTPPGAERSVPVLFDDTLAAFIPTLTLTSSSYVDNGNQSNEIVFVPTSGQHFGRSEFEGGGGGRGRREDWIG
jgi:hypothetical protein